jgi:hypothetical protein
LTCTLFQPFIIGDGRKNLLATLEKKYSLFIQSQITWRGDSTHTWTEGGETRRVFLQREPLPQARGEIRLLGKQVKRKGSDWLFDQLLDQWGSRDVHFNTFLQKYKDYKATCDEKEQTPQEFRNWTDGRRRSSSVLEKKWQSMDACVYEVERVTLDGVLFRTGPSQNRKNTNTDNSYILGETYVNRDEVTTRVDCYGRLQKIYLHFMYPPTPEDLKQATDERRIDPYKISTAPWKVFVKCKWYRTSKDLPSESYNPINGLLQVHHDENWNTGCPFIALRDCYAKNLMLWPSVPFDEKLYDDDGDLLPNQLDNRNRSDDLHDVIFHHD